MIRRVFSDGLAWLWIASAVFGAALWFSVPARADAVDDAFIATIDGRGIPYPSEAYAIRAGRAVCGLLDAGGSPTEVALVLARDSYLGVADAGFFVGASVGAYCSWHAGEITGVGRRLA